jgi:hypothetical protein
MARRRRHLDRRRDRRLLRRVRPTVCRWIAEYEDCPIVKVGGRHFVLRADIAAWLVNPRKRRREQS